jgi:hypothetical protein
MFVGWFNFRYEHITIDVYYTCTSSQIRDTDLALSQYVTLHWLHTKSIIVSDLFHSKKAEKETRYVPGDPGEESIPTPIITPVVLLFLKTRWQVICDTYIWLTKSWWRPHNFLSDEST